MNRVYMIAEAGVNHDGRLDRALDLIDIAKAAGADAVKFQLFNAATCKGPMRSVLAPLELSKDAHRTLYVNCQALGIDYMASCFDPEQVDFVKELGCQTLKIGSGELTNKALLQKADASGLAVILSTGMSERADIADALEIVFDPVLLHCVSAYPVPLEHANLRAIQRMRKAFPVKVGFSDHTIGTQAMIAAVALGACVMEKHFTYDKRASGPDHHMSAAPAELKDYVYTLRLTEAMLGDGEKRVMPCEERVLKVARGRW